MNAPEKKPVTFEMIVERVVVDETAATLDLKLPPTTGKRVEDEHLAHVGAWFAGLNDEYGSDEPIRVAIYGDDGHRFRPQQRVRITVEPIEETAPETERLVQELEARP